MSFFKKHRHFDENPLSKIALFFYGRSLVVLSWKLFLQKWFYLLFFLSFISLSVNVSAQTHHTERVPTKFFDGQKPISLEMVVFKPDNVGEGPFPTLVFNHGSTGRGDDPKSFTITETNEHIVNFFTSRGWLVVFPQRRGRGNSDGLYDEGFIKSRKRYSIAPKIALLGLERALEDVDEIVKYLKAHPLVDNDKMIIGGVSRGGILAIAYAGTRPNSFIGAINFVGGWIGEFSGSDLYRFFYDYMKKTNTETFKRSARSGKPTIWLYGENDSFYKMKHIKKNFDAFISAGGIGTFHTYNLGANINGHYLTYRPDLWQNDISTFLNALK